MVSRFRTRGFCVYTDKNKKIDIEKIKEIAKNPKVKYICIGTEINNLDPISYIFIYYVYSRSIRSVKKDLGEDDWEVSYSRSNPPEIIEFCKKVGAFYEQGRAPTGKYHQQNKLLKEIWFQ